MQTHMHAHILSLSLSLSHTHTHTQTYTHTQVVVDLLSARGWLVLCVRLADWGQFKGPEEQAEVLSEAIRVAQHGQRGSGCRVLWL